MNKEQVLKEADAYYNELNIKDDSYKKNLLLLALLWSFAKLKSGKEKYVVFDRYKETEHFTIRKSYANKKKLDSYREKDYYIRYVRTTAENPREEHLKLVGTVKRASDKWWDTHLPPSEWNCQCSVAVHKDRKEKNKGSYPVEAVLAPQSRKQLIRLKELSYYKELTAKDLGIILVLYDRIKKEYSKNT